MPKTRTRSTPKHGGSGMEYASYGCRCQECRAVNTERARKRREERDLSQFTGEHGKPSTYSNWSCRCEPCRTAWNQKCRNEYHARKQRALKEGH